MRVIRALALMPPAVALAACVAVSGDYELVFADEFNDGSAPSAATWTVETGYGPKNNGWGNNEWQLYTNSRDNVRVENGNLVLAALCPMAPCGVRDGTVTSGKINSRGKFNFKFGKITARIKPPVGDVAWPAFWALGANYPDTAWPLSGELDFMEMHNFESDARTTHTTMHWCDQTKQAPAACSWPAGWVLDTQHRTFTSSLGDDFHIWEVDWNEARVIGKIDGETYFSRQINPATMEEFLRDFFLIFNVAMGGTLGSGEQPPDPGRTYRQTMLVDYVRVFQSSGPQARLSN